MKAPSSQPPPRPSFVAAPLSCTHGLEVQLTVARLPTPGLAVRASWPGVWFGWRLRLPCPLPFTHAPQLPRDLLEAERGVVLVVVARGVVAAFATALLLHDDL